MKIGLVKGRVSFYISDLNSRVCSTVNRDSAVRVLRVVISSFRVENNSMKT